MTEIRAEPNAVPTSQEGGASAAQEAALSDDELELMRRRRFEGRVQRVLAVMREERVDWRGLAFVAPDGRIGVRVVPVETDEP